MACGWLIFLYFRFIFFCEIITGQLHTHELILFKKKTSQYYQFKSKLLLNVLILIAFNFRFLEARSH